MTACRVCKGDGQLMEGVYCDECSGTGRRNGDHPAFLDELEAKGEANRAKAEAEANQSGEGGETGEGRKSASTVLVEIAEELYAFAVSDSGETFAVPKAGHKVVVMLRGGKRSLRAQLARHYFTRHRKAAPQQALADALLVIEGMAQESDPDELHLRVARHDGALWLDLGDDTGRAVRITGNGWTVEGKASVLFKRTALNSALAEPVRGGQLSELWNLLNVEPDDRPLVAAWLAAVFLPEIPHPVLGLFGEQGTGKSTAMELLVSAVDPSPVPRRKAPRDSEAWVTAAAGSWVVGLDNLSDVPPWLSDSICRASTGEGDVRRRLYTDGDLHVFAFRRCVILNGIDLGGLRGDLADRALPITLARIPDEDRLDETELWPRWHAAHPRILGAILDLVSEVIRLLPSVALVTKPRMADFAKVLAAVDQVLETDGLARYLAKQGSLAADSLDGDDFILSIPDSFQGTSAELLTKVTPKEENWRAPKGWPGNARAVTQKLHRQAPVMRKAGWTVEDDEGRNKDKTVRWTIARPTREVGNPDPQDPPNPPNETDGGLAGQASHESGPSPYVDTDDYEARHPDLFTTEETTTP